MWLLSTQLLVSGDAFKLGYTLPHEHKCAQIDNERSIAYTKDDTTFYKVNLTDGHLVSTYIITTPIIPTYFTQWNYDPDTNILYGICLEPSETALHWNYTWCHIPFDERGMGRVKFGSFVTPDGEPPGFGFCSRILMNMNTFKTGQYWYTVANSIFV